jgi:hypothetical protein
MTINLSQYVGKKIIAELIDGSVLAGEVEYTINESWHSEPYPYSINGWLFNKCGYGMTKPRIVKIRTSFDGSDIAQKAPNINLDDFVGQNVYVKLKSGKYLLRVLEKKSKNVWYLHALLEYRKNGTPCISQSDDRWDIEEIYGEGAYEINTKSTFDNPNDYQIEQAKQLLSQMSEEQVAKLLKSLK